MNYLGFLLYLCTFTVFLLRGEKYEGSPVFSGGCRLYIIVVWLTESLMDEGTVKTKNPKFRLYWCLIEFIDWRYSQSCWYFRPL
jgi:hypothetical protein